VFAGARGSCRREQDGIMTDPMAAPRLAQLQPAAKHGVFGGVLLEISAHLQGS
jgi:hypothetical protein